MGIFLGFLLGVFTIYIAEKEYVDTKCDVHEEIVIAGRTLECKK